MADTFIGNHHIIARLEQVLKRNTACHAYLFSGPEGVGKLTAAMAFSRAVVSGGSALEFEGNDAKTLANIEVVFPQTEKSKHGVMRERDISVEVIREAQRRLSLFPVQAKTRVLIIDRAHRLSVGAQNALLKTIEEPASTASVVLVTNDRDRLLATVRSRCVEMKFSLVSQSELVGALTRLGIGSEPEFRESVIACAGRPALVFQYFQDPEFRQRRLNMLQSIQVMRGDQTGIIDFAEQMSKDVAYAREWLELWQWTEWNNVLENDSDELRYRANRLRRISTALWWIGNTQSNARLELETLLLSVVH